MPNDDDRQPLWLWWLVEAIRPSWAELVAVPSAGLP